MIRRDFIKHTALSSVGALIQPLWLSETKTKLDLSKVGLQLYTVRQNIEDDLLSTLRKIKDIGYSHVEGASYNNRKFYGHTREHYLKILRDVGLKMTSNHIEFGRPNDKDRFNMNYNWEKVCEDAAFMGQEYLVCPWLPNEIRTTIDNDKSTAKLLNICGVAAKKHGLKMCYHNHGFEFVPLDKILPFDILAQETDSDLVHFELDIYWTHRAGIDTQKLIKKYRGRFPLFHIKDMEAAPNLSFTEFGTGVINWKKMFKLSEIAGLKYFYIEQDDMKKYNAIESIQISYDNLKAIKL